MWLSRKEKWGHEGGRVFKGAGGDDKGGDWGCSANQRRGERDHQDRKWGVYQILYHGNSKNCEPAIYHGINILYVLYTEECSHSFFVWIIFTECH